jgi:PTS system glucose-specific IIC component
MIGKFKIATPGRLGNYIEESATEDGVATEGIPAVAMSTADAQVNGIIEALGGRENISDVDACMTRLRVTVKDPEAVKDESAWKRLGALGLVKKGTGIQAIYGPKADVLKSDINDVLGV